MSMARFLLQLLAFGLLVFSAACTNFPTAPATQKPVPDTGSVATVTVPPAAQTPLPDTGSTATPPASQTAVPQPTTELGDLNQFSQRLFTAIEARDYNTLRGLMRNRFSIATWNTQLLEVSADEAMAQLRAGPLADGAAPAVRPGTDVVDLLSGTDPLSLWGPTAEVVRAFHVMGLGAKTTDEAVLVIGRDAAQGSYYLHGILLPPGGSFRKVSGPFEVVETQVKLVQALEDVNLRAGPGTQYDVLGQVFGGMSAQVTGVSPDGGWYRVPCQEDASGFCWLTTDPTLTQPVSQ